MRQVPPVLTVLLVLLSTPGVALAQSAQPDGGSVPRLITISGVFPLADGQPASGVETVTVSIYADQQGGAPVWQETQTVALDERGRYTLLLGAMHAGGIPPAVLASGAQWLGTAFERAGEVEGARRQLTSVPYALRAADAEMLGGLPPSAYALAVPADTRDRPVAGASAQEPVPPQDVQPGTTNFLAKYVSGINVGNSAVYETAGTVGLGTSTPFDIFHARFTSPDGSRTGLAVQNLGNTATSYSGMLFYDQNGALGQFQGFNNSTHEYRINNIARNGLTLFDGSINFMLGSTSRFLVASNGRIGVGTTTPSTLLEINNAAASSDTADLTATTYFNNSFSSLFIGRKARGTAAAPAAVQGGDQLAFFGGRGYGATSFTNSASGMAVRAAESWTDTAQGTTVTLSTTTVGTILPVPRLTLDSFGSLGIGTSSPQGALEVFRNNSDTKVFASSFNAVPQFLTRVARGNPALPGAVQDGDELGLFGATGYGATGFSDIRAGMAAFGSENWSDTAQGTALVFGTTPLGTVDAQVVMSILPNGNVGIGTPPGANDEPTALDRLQVFGDIRIGTSGTNGCVKDFGGAGLLGMCGSDRRFKRDVTPFGAVLNSLAALQPVHYFWRSAEFPERHFGGARAYGLIAQDVEQVLPELVVSDEEGFKAIDYSKLPLLLIQAVKELKAENDAMKQRLTELERLVTGGASK